MNELHRDRAFAYAGSHTLHRTVAHIAHRKHSGHIGLEQARIAIEGPAFGTTVLAPEIGAGQDESAFIALDDARQPVGPRHGANEDKQRAGGDTVDLPAI